MPLKFNPTNGKLDLVSDLSTLPATYLKLDASNDPIVGNLLIKPTTNSTTTFQIQPSGSTTPVLNVDTTNGNVGIGTTTPNANALLDISSTTKAFMPPRMATTQKAAIASPTEGMVVWDSTLHVLAVYNGTAWQSVTAA